MGTAIDLPFEVLRYRHGYGKVVLHSPLGWWGGLAFFLLDGFYGIFLWNIQQSERRVGDLQREKAGSETGTEKKQRKPGNK
jgi:hypothetical protein